MHENGAGGRTIAILAVIVLYKVSPEDCVTLCSLIESYSRVSAGQVRLKILLFDNAPAGSSRCLLPPDVAYHPASANVGLADAYNYALQEAAGCDWLLTLDQDTRLPETFLTDLLAAIAVGGADPRVGAIVPQIVDDGRILSPNHFVLNGIPKAYSDGFIGVARRHTYAFNSGSLIRVSSLREVGGYSRMFWLDYCDFYIYARLNQRGMRVYVAGNIKLEHKFSMFDIKNSVSVERYRNFVNAASAFCDMEFGMLGGLYHTATLILRIYKHWRRGDGSAIRRVANECLKRRLFVSKSCRLSLWRRAAEERAIKSPSL